MAHIDLGNDLPGIRGLMAYLNDCFYCHTSHGATTPTDLSSYDTRGRQIAEKGYGNHIFSAPQPVSADSPH